MQKGDSMSSSWCYFLTIFEINLSRNRSSQDLVLSKMHHPTGLPQSTMLCHLLPLNSSTVQAISGKMLSSLVVVVMVLPLLGNKLCPQPVLILAPPPPKAVKDFPPSAKSVVV